MRLRSWWRNLATRSASGRSPGRASIRLGFEQLEDRLVPAHYTVNTLIDENNGVTVGGVSLRDAITAANGTPEADTINFTVNGALNLSLGALPNLTGDLTLAGPGADNLTVARSTAASYRIFTVSAGTTVEISGMTLLNGRPSAGGGGGILATDARLTVRDCVFNGNTGSAAGGGGISFTGNGDDTLDVIGCVFRNSTGNNVGGGIAFFGVGNDALTVTDCILENNSASGAGGGIYLRGAVGGSVTATVTGTTLRGNTGGGSTTQGFGGGIGSLDAKLTVRDSLIDDNHNTTTAGIGGGICFIGTGANTLTLEGCDIQNNTPFSNAAGVHVGGTPGNAAAGTVTATIIDCAFSGNNGGIGAMSLSGGDGSSFSVTGSTFANNVGNDTAGAVSVFGSGTTGITSVAFTDCVFSGNSGGTVGGASVGGSVQAMTLTDCTFENNTGTNSGGLRYTGGIGSTLAITGCRFTDNTGGSDGGGLFADRTMTLQDSTFTGNTAGGRGGGFYRNSSTSGTATVSGTTFAGNAAGTQGGGMYASATVINSTFSGNTAGTDGGGLWIGGGTVSHTTLTGNRADADGNGTGTGGGLSANSGVILRHVLVAGNFRGISTTRSDVGTALSSTGSNNLIGDGTGMTGLTNGTNGNKVGTAAIPLDPKLGPLADNGGPTQTHALLPTSPAIDAGNNASVTVTIDQRGFPRIADGNDPDAIGTVDIGAFELTVSVGTVANQTTNEDTPLTVIVTVGDAALAGLTVTATSSNPQLLPNNAAHLAVDGTGSTRTLTLTPAADQWGTTTITVTVARGAETAQTTFLLTVLSVNDPPVADNDAYFMTQGTILLASSVLDNDCDSHAEAPGEGNVPLTAQLISNPSHGQLTLNGDGFFSYEPVLSYQGTDEFTYRTSDAQGGFSNAATVRIIVTAAANDPGNIADALPDKYSYSIANVPDFDQRRELWPFPVPNGIPGLPGDGGMYCVPTSLVDWMAYIANHGYPTLHPGERNWAPGADEAVNAENYDDATFFLAAMGQLMGTDPQKGTGDAGPGTLAWLTATGHDDEFELTSHGLDATPLTFNEMVALALDGGLISIGIGGYLTTEKLRERLQTKLNADPPPSAEDAADYQEQLDLLEGQAADTWWRGSGHAVILVGGAVPFGTNPVSQISIQDAAKGDNYHDDARRTQSPFGVETYDTQGATASIGWMDREADTTTVEMHDLPTITYHKAADGRMDFIDSYLAIRPKYGLTAEANELIFDRPIQIGGWNRPVTTRRQTATGGNVVDLAMDPVLIYHPYLTDDSNSVFRVNSVTGDSEEWVTGLDAPKRLAFGGPDQNLFVLEANHLTSLGRDGQVRRRIALPGVTFDAIATDESRERLVAVSAAAGRVYYYDFDLNLRDTLVLPSFDDDPSAAFPASSARASVGIDPTDGTIWLHRRGSTVLSRLKYDPDGQLLAHRYTVNSYCGTNVTLNGEASDDGGPDAMTVDGRGHVFLSINGVWAELDRDGNRVTDSIFTGLPAGDVLQVLRSFDNFNPSPNDPAFFNEVPENDPLADAGPDQVIDEGGTVHFDGTHSADLDGDPLTYAWDFGDGSTGVGPAPSHTYPNDGNYTVTLTVSDGREGIDTDTMAVQVRVVVPTVTINQAAGQADPASTAPIRFTVVFSETVTGFDAADILLGGTAGATTASVSGAGPTYTVSVSGMTQSGTVTASVRAGAALDSSGDASTASTTTDNAVTYQAPVSAFTAQYAFTLASSPTVPGAIRVLPTVYSPAAGFGWVRAPLAVDRGGPNNLLRALHYQPDDTFLVDIPSGIYYVTVVAGDASRFHDNVEFSFEGVPVAVLSNLTGQFVTQTFKVSVSDGQLTLRMRDLGASDPNAVINALYVRSVPQTLTLLAPAGPPDSAGQFPVVEADGLTEDVYRGTGAAPGALLTVTASAGTLLGGGAVGSGVQDVSTLYAGLQVQADATGAFIFRVRRSTGIAPADLTVTDVFGAAIGSVRQPYVLPHERHLDFDLNAAGPTQAGYYGMGPTAYVSAAVNALGWEGGGVLAANTANPPADLGNLLRDIHYASRRTFTLDLPPGAYQVTATFGDAAGAHDTMDVRLGGVSVLGTPPVATPAGQFTERHFPVAVGASGRLALELDGSGGSDPNFVIAALEVRPTADVLPITLTRVGTTNPSDPDGSDGVAVDTYEGTVGGAGLPDGSLVTVRVSLGAVIDGQDGSARYIGVQRAVSGNRFTFQVRRPSGTGTGSVTVEAAEVTGRARGTMSRAYVPPRTRRFDFDAPGSPTQAGWFSVLGSDTYTPERGHGWASTALAFDRRTAHGLLRDGHYGSDNTFLMQVKPNVTYNVRLYLSDPSVYHDTIDVYAEGVLRETVATLAAGSVRVLEFTVSSADGLLELRLRGLGGIDPSFVINGLELSEDPLPPALV